MNNSKRKIFSGILALSTFAAAVPSLAAIPADVSGTRYEQPAQVLSALKIMIGDDTGAFRPDDTIIRSEVTKIAIHALGLENAAESMKGQSKFPDVSTEHWANGYINLASSNGIIIGDDTGNFRPNDEITYAEAMTILVRILGYEPKALQNGGYPNGFIQTGTANGLNKNVTGSAYEPISRGNVAYMTNNALTVKLMEQTDFGSNPTYEVVDKTLLKDKLKVTLGQGQITAISSASLTGSSTLKQGQIKIDDTVYDTAYNMNNLLGYNVDYYVDDDTHTVILTMPTSGKNSVIEVKADLFKGVSNKNSKKIVEYYKDESSSKTSTAEIAADAVMIYNGKRVDFDDTLLDISESSGKVTLLDTDKNGSYDKVFVTEYRNIFVSDVSSSGKIVDKYGNASIKLDDNVTYRITKGLEELKVTDIKKNNVLSVVESRDSELYDISVSTETVSGKITGTDSEGIFIGENHYKIAPNFKETLNAGDEFTFYLDIEGKIAGTDAAVSTGTKYAYLIKAYTSTDADDTSNFKLLNSNGEETILESGDKIRFNGTSTQAKTVVSSLGSNSQLITYNLNSSGKISEINTAADKTASGEIDKNSFTMNYSLTDAVYNASQSRLGNIKLASDTIIFDISEGENKYSVKNIEMFEDEQKYNVNVFDLSEDYTANVIVVTQATLMPAANTAAAVVKSIANAVNSDDETTHQVTLLVDGAEKKLLAENTNVLVKHGDQKLEEGDIIQYKTNSDGEIISVRLLFDIKSKDTETEQNPVKNLSTVYGKVQKKFDTSMNVTVNNGNAYNVLIPEECKIYSIDTTQSKNKVTTATVDDILAFDEDDNNRVFITFYEDDVKEIFIVK